MSIGKTLLVIGILLTVAAVLLGRQWWVFATEAFLDLASVAWISACGS
jgi:hypothetical protein